MTTLALVLAVAAGTTPSPAAPPTLAPLQQPSPDSFDAEQERRRRATAISRERSRRRRGAVNTFLGASLELGSGILYAVSYSFIAHDLSASSASCNAAAGPCRTGGAAELMWLPTAASGMSAIGATRVAAARGASIWRSPLFWAGTATELAAYVAWTATTDVQSGNARLTWDTTFLVGAVVGSAMQLWGAFTAPPRN